MKTRILAGTLAVIVIYGAERSPSWAQYDSRYPVRVAADYPETPEVFQQYGYEYYKKYSEAYGSQSPKDSFRYYGPNGLWWKWNPSQQRGRDMWIFWTAGNQKFYRRLQEFADKLPLGFTVDFFRVLDTRNRSHRFRDVGLINEPNCSQAGEPDEYGMWLDRWEGDPLGYYPNSYYSNDHDLKKYWGEPTGVLGMRKFK
ncbi:MAG: hypothetical protein JJ992_10765, partial [Planctomycetes bacterium]|nr:hypothetical protein [Planctomycetota bacterium]